MGFFLAIKNLFRPKAVSKEEPGLPDQPVPESSSAQRPEEPAVLDSQGAALDSEQEDFMPWDRPSEPDEDFEHRPVKPYASSLEQLWDEMRRIDLLVRAQTARWKITTASTKSEQMWGMVQVSDAEVEAYLNSEYEPPDAIPEKLIDVLEPSWKAAAAWAAYIRRRVNETPPAIPLRLERLRRLFDLSDGEVDLLLVCLLPELDGRYRRLFGYLQDDASRTQPTSELVLQILQPSYAHSSNVLGRGFLDRDGPLLRNLLLAVGGEARGDEALPMRSLRVDDRISAYLLESHRPDGRLAGILSYPARAKDWDSLGSGEPWYVFLRLLAKQLLEHREGEKYPVLLFHGPYGGGQLKAARALCSESKLPLLVASVSAALNSPLGWERILQLCYREAALQGATLYWTRCGTLFEHPADRPAEVNPARWEALMDAAENYPGLSILSNRQPWDPSGRFRSRPFLNVEFPTPRFDLRVKLWERVLPPSSSFLPPVPERFQLAGELANDFQFTEGQMKDALVTAYGEAARRSPQAPRLMAQDIYEGCRRQSGRSLVTFAHRIEPRSQLTFHDLILPPANRRQLEELSQRIQDRSMVYSTLGLERKLSLGKGLIALFTGASGTGKTMAAELLANQRGVDLYKVDLSAVSSKWVGETEKNLARVFAEAEDANAIIFFDEADALFGKRGEVKEAQDRWANMEVNYLLQRVEEFAGVVILASNLRQNIDDAFLRRIQWLVDFPYPDASARLEIYLRMFPDTVRYPDRRGLEILAKRFRFTGGSIKNVVVDATFRALKCYVPGKEKPRIRMIHLILASAREFQKLGIPITKNEFGESYYNFIVQEILMPSPDPA